MWQRLKRIGMTALFVLFSLIGLAIALFGRGPDRLLGVGVLLFFGGGGVAWFVVTAPTTGSGLRIGSINAFGRHETGFIADYDRRRQLVAAVGGLSMGAAAILLGFVPDSEGSTVMPTWLGVGLGVLMLGIGLLGLARSRRGNRLVLTPRGLAAISATGPIFVPWAAIAGIGEMEVRGSPFLAIRVTDPAQVEMGRLHRLVHVLERNLMNVDLSFPLLSLRTDPQQLLAAVERYAADPDLRRLIGTPAELAAIHAKSPVDADGGSDRDGPPRLVPSLRLAAGVSLLLFGALLAIVSLAAALDEVTPAQERSRSIGLVVFGVLALAQVGAGVMFLRRVGAGRWLGPVVVLAVLGFALVALAGTDADSRSTGIVIVAIVAAHAMLVVLGAVRWSPPS